MTFDYEKEARKLFSKVIRKKDIIIERPKDSIYGDYAFPCFLLAKEKKKSPVQIAKELISDVKAEVEKNKIFSEAKLVGPYINLFVHKGVFAENVLKEIMKKDYGKGSKKKDKIMVEYCQVNTHKAFHVGHLRGTLLGMALIRLLRYNGYKVVSANYQGDIGTHVAKSLWYLTKHFKGKFPDKDKGTWLGEIYQKANKLLSKNEDYNKEVSEILQKLENNDKELTKLWKETRKWSLDDFEILYDKLNVKFDEYFFESQMEKEGKELVSALVKKKIAHESDGAIVIDLEKYNLSIFLLLKSDGTTLYSTKDLALAKAKFEKYKVDRSLHVVGSEQKFYFEQVFKTLDLMGFKQAKKCFHLPYELVNLEGGKISSREGELILAMQLINDVIIFAKKEVKKRHSDWNDKEVEKTAESIALAGIKFRMLSQDNNKPIVFSVEKVLDFEGETGPYIQYAHARICSILRNCKKDVKNADLSLLTTTEDKKIISILSNFPTVLEDCSENYKLFPLCRYLLDLSQAFNEYYHKHQILKEKDDVRDARLFLIQAVKKVISEGLELLGIEAPERM